MGLTLVCFTGAGFLLQAEGTWLTDEKCARSFGNCQAEPAVDGQKSAYTPKPALALLFLLAFFLMKPLNVRQERRFMKMSAGFPLCRTVLLPSYKSEYSSRDVLYLGGQSVWSGQVYLLSQGGSHGNVHTQTHTHTLRKHCWPNLSFASLIETSPLSRQSWLTHSFGSASGRTAT